MNRNDRCFGHLFEVRLPRRHGAAAKSYPAGHLSREMSVAASVGLEKVVLTLTWVKRFTRIRRCLAWLVTL
eukprot:262284-Pleurochrysis_carterae.AAC.1